MSSRIQLNNRISNDIRCTAQAFGWQVVPHRNDEVCKLLVALGLRLSAPQTLTGRDLLREEASLYHTRPDPMYGKQIFV
ncbi:MAG: hypothetical protein L0387_24870 [Acidobacteria bacterium]|nr:hypothetical protein [Acidobacteriota bacterium]